MDGREARSAPRWMDFIVCAAYKHKKNTQKPIPKQVLLTRPPTVALYMHPALVNKSEEAA